MAWDDFFAPNGGPWIVGSKFGYQSADRIHDNFDLLKRFQYTGTGSPEGLVTAPVGSVYTRSDGGVGTTLYIKQSGAGNTGWAAAAGGTGDVVGPASATDNGIARFDGATGKLIQNSGITIADGAAGTLDGSNSGDVTLAGTPTYLTIAAQVITRALIDLASHVTGRLPYANLTASTAANRLMGRGSAGGAGDWQEIALGSNLSMSGTTLNATGGGGGGALDDLSDVVITTPATGQLLRYNGTSWVNATPTVRTVGITIDGAGSVITTGIKGDVEVPFAGTITKVTMLADQSGSIVIDILKDSYANYPPVDADSITASAPPTITTATKSQDTTLTGWSPAITAGDTLRFKVVSVTSIQRVAMILTITV